MTVSEYSFTIKIWARARRCRPVFAKVTGAVVVIQDADLEYDPSELLNDPADPGRCCRCRLRIEALGRQAAAGLHVLAPDRERVSDFFDQSALQHHPFRYGDLLQKCSDGR